MGFNRIQSVTGLASGEEYDAALAIAARAQSVKDGWDLLEACGLVAYQSGEAPDWKSAARQAAKQQKIALAEEQVTATEAERTVAAPR